MEYRTRINLFRLKTLLLWSWMWVPAVAVFAVLKAAELLGELAGRAADRINESEPAWLSAALRRVEDMERRGLEEKRGIGAVTRCCMSNPKVLLRELGERKEQPVVGGP